MKKTLIAVAGIALSASAALAADGTFAFGSVASGAIPDNSLVGLGGSVHVVGTFEFLSTVSVNINFGTGTTVGNREHTWLGDLVCTLSYDPDGAAPAVTASLMDRNGTGTFSRADDMNGAYTIVDGGGSLWTTAAVGGNIPAGSYSASGGTAETETVVSLNGTFGGQVAKSNGGGVFSIFIRDAAGGDVGDIVSWGVNFTTIPTPGAAALLGLGGLVSLRRRR